MKTTRPFKARGAVSNPQSRYDRQRAEPVDDGWHDDSVEHAPDTTIEAVPAKSIVTTNDSPDIGFDQSINPYRGCEHGCIYCFARPTHAYLGLSPGLDFESRIIAKPNAAALLEVELRAKGYRCKPIAVGTNTDPYQPAERELGIMRACLKVMAAFNQPVMITTKSLLVTRDIDILAPMAERKLASVAISVTSLDRDLCRTLEPRAAVPAQRLKAIEMLAAAGIPVTVMVAPVIPFVTDQELEHILAAARAAGATSASHTLVRLPKEVGPLFEEWLRTHLPMRAERVLAAIKGMRGGVLDEPRFHRRFSGTGSYALMLRDRFTLAFRKHGFPAGRNALDCEQFRPPPRAGDQLALF